MSALSEIKKFNKKLKTACQLDIGNIGKKKAKYFKKVCDKIEKQRDNLDVLLKHEENFDIEDESLDTSSEAFKAYQEMEAWIRYSNALEDYAADIDRKRKSEKQATNILMSCLNSNNNAVDSLIDTFDDLDIDVLEAMSTIDLDEIIERFDVPRKRWKNMEKMCERADLLNALYNAELEGMIYIATKNSANYSYVKERLVEMAENGEFDLSKNDFEDLKEGVIEEYGSLSQAQEGRVDDLFESLLEAPISSNKFSKADVEKMKKSKRDRGDEGHGLG